MRRGEVLRLEFDPADGSEVRKTRPDMLAVEHALRVQLALPK